MGRFGLRKGGSFGMSGAHQQHAAELNLTPMIDMMTILMVFLIKSYSVSPQYLTPTQDIELATTISEVAAGDAAVLIIGKDGVILEGKTIVPYQNGLPEQGALSAEGTFPALQSALESIKGRTLKIAELNASVTFTGTLILQADKGTDFKDLRPVLRTASLVGFHDFKFAGLYPD